MKTYLYIIIVNTIIIILALILVFIDYKTNIFNKIKLFNSEILFSLIAPASKPNKKFKYISDKIYKYKVNIEDSIKISTSDKIIFNEIDVYSYKDIKNELDEKYFFNMTDGYTKPIIIKNVFSDEDLQYYNYEMIIQNHGDISIEAINNDKHTSTNTSGTIMTFEEYINSIRRGEKLYLTVNNSIANILNIDTLMVFYNNLFKTHGFKNIFIGNKESYTHLHCEIAASCGIQLNGNKKWYLINPDYSEHLHSVSDKNNIFKTSAYGFNKNYDKFVTIPHYEFIVEKGDFLYVPPWWWHETLNITDETIMFSYRPSLFEAPYKTNLSYTLQGLKNSIGFNNLAYPILTKLKLFDPNEDTVIKSIAELKNRIPY